MSESSPLRCPQDAQHFNHDLREDVADAIRKYPNSEAEWWVGPEAVLRAVERHLGYDPDAETL